MDNKDYGKAIRDFNSATQLDPNIADPRLFASRGKAYLERKDYAKAIEDLTKAIHLNPKSASAYFDRARAYEGSGDSEKADKDSKKFYEMQYGEVRIEIDGFPLYRWSK